LRLLAAFHWPGNIRQLENAIFRAVVLADGDSIGVAEFPQINALIGAQAPNAEQVQSDALLANQSRHPVPAEPLGEDTLPSPAAAPAFPVEALPLLDGDGHVRALEDIEADLIRYAITHYRGQMSEVARRLRIGRSTLYRKLEALGISERGEADAELVAEERHPRKIA